MSNEIPVYWHSPPQNAIYLFAEHPYDVGDTLLLHDKQWWVGGVGGAGSGDRGGGPTGWSG